jgi:hypothetical protein
MAHGAIPDASACADIGGVEQGLHLRPRAVGDQRPIGVLRRNRQPPTAVLQEGRHTLCDHAPAGCDRGEARVACPRALAPLSCKRRAQIPAPWGIKML